MGLAHFLYREEMAPQQHYEACHFRCISKVIYVTPFNKILIE